MELNLPALRTPTDVLAVVPYLLGFAPTDSVVILGLRARKVVFQVRADIPDPRDVPVVVTHVCQVIARQRVTAALIIGYGAAESVAPAIDAVRTGLARRGIELLDALRVTDGRYWSYLCQQAGCCPSEGTAYDTTTTTVAASATMAGISPAASRGDLVARLAPPQAELLMAARNSAFRAAQRRAELAPGPGASSVPPGAPEATAVLAAGRQAVDGALERARRRAAPAITGAPPFDLDDLTWLATLLRDTGVRDLAWQRIDEDPQLHLELWSEVLRRVDPDLAAAPASLLAFAAWQFGEGALASIALDRAEAAEPGYPMAALLGTALHQGVPPSSWHKLLDSASDQGLRPRRRPDGGLRRRIRS